MSALVSRMTASVTLEAICIPDSVTVLLNTPHPSASVTRFGLKGSTGGPV
jgi:hypothetical protein